MNKKKSKDNFLNSLKQAFKNPSFSPKEMLGYSAGCFGNTMGQDMVGTFLILFLTDYMGIAAAYITILMVVAQVINALVDPIAGAIVDRTETHYGKARPFLLVTPLPLTVTSVLLFVVPNVTMFWRIVWVFVFYIIYCIADSFYDMSLMTISVRMTTNTADRKNFYTIASLGGNLGTMLPGGVTPILISLYAGYEKEIYLVAAVFFALVGLAMMILPFNLLREKNIQLMKPVPVKINAKAILLNRPLILSMISKVCECFRQVTFGGLVYLYKQTLGAYWLSTFVGTFSVTFAYIGLLSLPFLGKRFSSRTIMVSAYFYTGAWYLILLMCGYSNLFIVGGIVAVSGATSQLLSATRKVLVADSIEYMEWITWKKLGTPVRSDGMVFAMNSLANRFTSAIKDMLLPIGLTIIGYVSAQTIGGVTINVVQSEATLHGIFYLITLPSIIGNFLAGAVLLFDDYTGKKKERILAELKQLHTMQKQETEQVQERV